MSHVMKEKMKEVLEKASFICLSENEVTTIDNQGWLSVHVYVVL